MPTTYLLLRNNKQIGPLSLDELLHYSLKPKDLIWVEGQSAGWSYPSEIDVLKTYVSNPEKEVPLLQAAKPIKESNTITAKRNSSATHIYVSLPAGMSLRTTEETEPTNQNLEAKAEALYNRVQAFTEGRAIDGDDTRYARSLEVMKQEYSSWQVRQKEKKKSLGYKKKLLLAASVVVITTTGFSLAAWIGSKSAISPAVTSISDPVTVLPINTQTTTASFNLGTDTFTSSHSTAILSTDSLVKAPYVSIKSVKPAAEKRKTVVKERIQLPQTSDSASLAAAPIPVPVEKPIAAKQPKKVVPLSQQVFVTGTFDRTKNGQVITGTQVSLQNNSTETLKTVAVTITYFKKEDRVVDTEKIYFYNVLPAATPVIYVAPNRRATAARFTITAITRADGSLYLIN